MRHGFDSKVPLASRGPRLLRRFALAASLAALSLAPSASSAPASVTIGQFVAAPTGCAGNNDWAQVSVASGNPYVVPGNGTITSWSHIAGAGAGQEMTMKIWRSVFGTTYTVVGHDGPRTLTASGLNTFPAGVPVKTGDVLGFHSGTTSPSACLSAITPGDAVLDRFGDAADGESPTFTATIVRHLNITAVFEPSNSFTLGAITRSKKQGTATITADVPNPGELTGSGKGVKVAGAAVISKIVTAAGDVKLTIRAKGKKKRTLNETGNVKVKPKITYTPTGGDPSTQSVKVKLKKNL